MTGLPSWGQTPDMPFSGAYMDGQTPDEFMAETIPDVDALAELGLN